MAWELWVGPGRQVLVFWGSSSLWQLCFLSLPFCLCQGAAHVMLVGDVVLWVGRQWLFLDVVPESLPRILFTMLGQDVGSSGSEGV